MDNLTPLKSRGLKWIRKKAYVSNGNAIIHTVSAGKSFYLVHSALMIRHYATGVKMGTLEIQDVNDITIAQIQMLTCADAEYGRGGSRSYPIPLEIPAGWNIIIYANAYTRTNGAIFGWEE